MRKCNRMYNHLAQSDATGKVSPCCIYVHDTDRLDEFKIQNIETFNSVLTSNAWRSLRAELAEDDIPQCINCWRTERSGNTSQRMWASQKPAQHEVLEDLELALDTTCNMMCRICRPGQSSKWYSATQVVKKLDSIWDQGQYKTQNVDLSVKDHLRRVINNSDLSSLKTLRLNGGEPFYSKNLKFVLEKIDRDAGLENVELCFNTNGSIFPDSSIQTLLQKARSLRIDFSLDAVGDLASVIRYGVPWEDIDRTIQQWREFSLQRPINFGMHTVISLMNFNKLEDLYTYSRTNNFHWTFYCLYGPDYLRVHQLPKNIRRNFVTILDDRKITEKINNEIQNHPVTPSYYDVFLDAMHTLDAYQNNSFENVNPEIYNLVKKLLKQ